MKVTAACVALLACCFSYLSNRYERIVAERQAHSNYSSKPRYTTTSTKSNTSAHTSGKPTPEKIGQMQRAAGYYYSDYDYKDAIDDYDNPEDYADDYEDYFEDWDAAYDYWEDHN